MKIAAICDFPYWQVDIGSAVRMESLCRTLGGVCELSVLCSADLPEERADFAGDVPYDLLDGAALRRIAEGVPGHGAPAVRAIGAYCASHGIDAVLTPYFNRFWMLERVPPHILRIIDTHDCQSQRARSFAQHGLIPTFVLDAKEEGALLDRYDLALAMSAADQEEFRQMTDIPVVTVPFRLPARPLPADRVTDGRSLLFIAAASPVNDMTLRYLLHEVMPLVDRRTVLRILGTVAVPETLPANTEIIRPGRVEDLAEIYAQTDLALNPTFAGGGVKTKTLEAIAHGVPVLTSDEGARGLRALLPEILIANDKESFAHRIGMLLDAPDRRAELGRRMLETLAAETPDWQAPLMHLLRALRAGRQEAQGA